MLPLSSLAFPYFLSLSIHQCLVITVVSFFPFHLIVPLFPLFLFMFCHPSRFATRLTYAHALLYFHIELHFHFCLVLDGLLETMIGLTFSITSVLVLLGQPCPVLSLSCPVLSCPVLSCPVLSCPVLSCPVLSCPVLSCPVLSCPVLSCPQLLCTVLSFLVLFCPLIGNHDSPQHFIPKSPLQDSITFSAKHLPCFL